MKKAKNETTFEILRLLLDGPQRQKKLQDNLGLTPANLFYHLDKLIKKKYILKEEVDRFGAVILNEIRINPPARQKIRKKLGLEMKNLTLISGFGKYETGYRVADIVYSLLVKENYKITRLFCFTTEQSLEKRNNFKEKERLRDIDEIITYGINEYRNYNSAVYDDLESIINKEMENAKIIIDITPLTKLFSINLLYFATKYQVPCVYLGFNDKGEPKLFNMSKMEINVNIGDF